jgi:hypothetical protein
MPSATPSSTEPNGPVSQAECGRYVFVSRRDPSRSQTYVLNKQGMIPSLFVFIEDAPCDDVPHAPATVDQVAEAKVKTYLRAELSLLVLGPVSDAVALDRATACRTCPKRNPSPDDPLGYCGSCGCGQRKRARLTVKGLMPLASCPINRWGESTGTGPWRLGSGYLSHVAEICRESVREAKARVPSAARSVLRSIASGIHLRRSRARPSNE